MGMKINKFVANAVKKWIAFVQTTRDCDQNPPYSDPMPIGRNYGIAKNGELLGPKVKG